jgi:CRISPR type IV-associated protein Csf1
MHSQPDPTNRLSNPTAPQLAALAFGLDPFNIEDGIPATEDSTCAYCGAPILAGDRVVPYPDTLSANFTDGRDVNLERKYACAACLQTAIGKPMVLVQKALVTEKGVFSLSKDSERAHFFLNPPKPPFAVCATSGINVQHILWKTPVTWSVDLIYARYDTLTLRIRRPHLLKSLEAAQKIAALKEGLGQKRHPFFGLNRHLNESTANTVRQDLRKKATAAGLTNEILILDTCTVGETWALTSLLGSKGSSPTPPAPIPFRIVTATPA